MKKKALFVAIAAVSCMAIIFAAWKLLSGKTEDKESSEAFSSEALSSETLFSEVPSDTVPYPYYFLSSKEGRFNYIIDENGKNIKTIDRNEVKDILSDTFEVGDNLVIEYAYDDIVICSEYTKESKYETKNYYAVNTSIKKVVKFMETDSGYCDYYNGSIYVVVKDHEKKFTFSEDLTYSEEDINYEDLSKATEGKFFRYVGISEQRCLSRIFDETGFIPYSKDNELYLFNRDGSFNKIDLGLKEADGISIDLKAFDKEHVIAYKYIDYNFDEAEIYNIETGELNSVKFDDASVFLSYDSGIIYNTVDKQTDTYMMDQTLYYAYDIEAGDNKLIYTRDRVPGSGYNTSYRDGFFAFYGKAFITDVDGAQGKWLTVDPKEDSDNVTPTDCVYDEYDALKYGTVEYEAPEYICPKCGKPVMKTYQEYFVLSDEYSEHASEINESIKENIVITDLEKRFGLSEDDCERHQYYSDELTDTHEEMVYKVDIIRDHYLTVDMSYYTMGVGAAHGYGAGYMLVYDLDTGKKMAINDFFDGTEEQFKDLMAKKSVEYFNSDEIAERGDRDHFGTDESIYASAYEQAGFDTSHLEFYEDHVTLVYYQYEIADYASGCFYIDIPYTEFHG